MNNNCSFIIYDYETFGINPSLDKVAQFAAIRVNYNFSILEDPYVFFCKIPNDYLPNPDAVLITGITPQFTLINGIKENIFSQKIYKLFTKYNNTCILGYNNINFDDEFTRNIFYRNFYDPYSWSWKNGNSRWDLVNVVRTFYIFSPNGSIKWPLNAFGVPSFKLDDLSKINHIKYKNKSHNAINDVYSTLSLCKLMYRDNSRLFNYLYNYRNKDKLKLIININDIDPLLYVSSIFGALRFNVSLVAPLFWHPYNKNILIVYDLHHYVDLLIFFKKFNFSDLYKSSCVNIPLKFIYINKCPVLFPMNILNKKIFFRVNVNIEFCCNNLNLLRTHSHLISNLRELFLKYGNKYINIFCNKRSVDEKLYNGFFSDYDKYLINKMLLSSSNKLSLFDSYFSDSRLSKLLFKYRARNFFFTLSEKEKIIWLRYRKINFTYSFFDYYINKVKSLYVNYYNDKKKLFIIKELFSYFSLYVKKIFNY